MASRLYSIRRLCQMPTGGARGDELLRLTVVDMVAPDDITAMVPPFDRLKAGEDTALRTASAPARWHPRPHLAQRHGLRGWPPAGNRDRLDGHQAGRGIGGRGLAWRLQAVVASCREPGRPLLDFLVAPAQAALRGLPLPSLLPAP